MNEYRYTLERSGWMGGSGRLCWVMLSPSTADDAVDDPTIRRVIRFTRDHGHASLVVVNLFAARATKPPDLVAHPHPVGPMNWCALKHAMRISDGVVFAWGASVPKQLASRAREQIDYITREARLWGRVPSCLGVTKDGHPRHPLYVPAATRLSPYPKAAT